MNFFFKWLLCEKIWFLNFSKASGLLLFLPSLLFSQIYILGDGVISDKDGKIKCHQITENSKADMYITENAFVVNSGGGLNANTVTVTSKINLHSSRKQLVKSANKNKYKSVDKKGVCTKENFAKKTLSGFKSLDSADSRFYSKMLQEKSAVAISSPFFGKKYIIAEEFAFEIVSIFSSLKTKTFSSESETFTVEIIAYTVRPPPAFCTC